MLLLTLFLTAAFAHRGRGNGNSHCTQSNLETQNSDLACFLQPFTGAVDGCGDSPSASTTTCSLRVEQAWPHADAVSAEPELRRLLHRGNGGRRNTARIEVTDAAVSGVVLRTGRRRNSNYDCLTTTDLTFSSAVMHPYVADEDSEAVTLGDVDEDSEQDSPYADITFTQTNENGASFDLVARCYVAYRQNDAEECVARGLKCHEGSYTIMMAGDDEGTTEESVKDFRMHCRDPTQLEDGQTFPRHWDYTETCN